MKRKIHIVNETDSFCSFNSYRLVGAADSISNAVGLVKSAEEETDSPIQEEELYLSLERDLQCLHFIDVEGNEYGYHIKEVEINTLS